jgi:hypothetical protein
VAILSIASEFVVPNFLNNGLAVTMFNYRL